MSTTVNPLLAARLVSNPVLNNKLEANHTQEMPIAVVMSPTLNEQETSSVPTPVGPCGRFLMEA